jgi:hypothetical protein
MVFKEVGDRLIVKKSQATQLNKPEMDHQLQAVLPQRHCHSPARVGQISVDATK